MAIRTPATDLGYEVPDTRAPARPASSIGGLFSKWIERLTAQRTEAALARLQQIDPTLVERIKAARQEIDRIDNK